MRPVLALFTVSVSQGLPRRRTIMLALLELAPAAIYLFATNSRTSAAAFQGVIEIGTSTFLALVLPVVAIVIAAGALGNERRDLTLSFIALRPIRRSVIALTKVAAASCAAIGLNVIGALALGISHTVRFGNGQVIGGLVAATIVASIAYASVFVPLGFLTDRAVIIGMAYLLIFENGIVFALSGLVLLSPWRLGAATIAGFVDGSRVFFDGAIGDLSMQRALVAMLIYALIGVGSTTWLLRRRDLA
jgi:ABC-type transport system involved in multi-copper enzyme maturation permease subunit